MLVSLPTVINLLIEAEHHSLMLVNYLNRIFPDRLKELNFVTLILCALIFHIIDLFRLEFYEWH